MATITGTAGNDTLPGTPTDDVISGLDGNDTISGGAGNDIISGGIGDDLVLFNVVTDGADSSDLGAGSDTALIAGTAGQLRLSFTSSEAGNGNPLDSNTMVNQDGGLAVRLQAEDGADVPTGATSRFDDEGISFNSATPGLTFDVRDLVSGTARGDQFQVVTLGTQLGEALSALEPERPTYLNAGMGDDTVSGGNANDFLVGGAGADILAGGAGNDSFIGGGGNDIVNGGAGSDTDIFNISTDGTEVADLGTDADIVNVSAAAAGQIRLTFTSSEVGNNNALDSNTMANQDGSLAVRMQLENGSDSLIGAVSRFDDEGITFNAATAGVTFDVRDLVSGTARGDQFQVVTLGTNANDVLTAVQPDRAYYLNAGMGDDTVSGGNANDFLVGGAGADILAGGAGNDSFIGGGGNDTINGGAGADLDIFNISTEGTEVADLGTDADAVNVSAAAAGQIRLTFTSSEVGNNNALDSNTMANQDGSLAVRMQLENGSDSLIGAVSRFDDEGITFNAATAGVTFDVRDLVSGTARGDQFGVVTLGTQASEALTATQADRAYYLNAGMGDDTVTGGNANDFLVGGAGADVLVGGAGNDSFIGGGGTDSIDGGAGSDTDIYNISTDGIETADLGADADLVNTSAAAPGQIRLTFTSAEVGNANARDSNTMTNQDGALAVRMQLEDAADGLTGVVSRFDDEGITFSSATTGVTFDVRDLVSGVARGDQFQVVGLGTSAADTLQALQVDRAYYLNGGMGNDTIVGGNANDFLVGGAGNDLLNAGAGNNTILGGAGNDTVLAFAGNTTITSGAGGSLIGLGVGTALVDSQGADTIVGGAGAATIGAATGSLVGLADGAATVSAAQGSTVVGGAGNAVIGVRGTGILAFSGAGQTTFIGGTGSSTVVGGAGSNTVQGGTGGGVFSASAGGNSVLVAGDGATTLFGGTGGDVLFARGAVGDVLVAGSGNQTLQGGGSTGNNVYFTGPGNTVVGLGSGQDVVIAGAGNSTVVSGTGADVIAFVNGRAGGQASLLNFKLGTDKISLQGYAAGEAGRALGAAATSGGTTTLTLSDNTRISLVGFSSANASVFG